MLVLKNFTKQIWFEIYTASATFTSSSLTAEIDPSSKLIFTLPYFFSNSVVISFHSTCASSCLTSSCALTTSAFPRFTRTVLIVD